MNIFTAWFLFLALFSLTAHAGTSSGGGGVGVRCVLPNGKSTLETLDIHEAKLKGLNFVSLPNNEEEAIELGSRLMANHYFAGYFTYVGEYQKFLKERIFEKIFKGDSIQESDTGGLIYQKEVSHLDLSNDYGKYSIAPNCHLEQIAYFDDSASTLFLNKSVFSEMDYLNQVAMFTHEIIYFLDRNYPSLHDDLDPNTPRTSEITRYFTGKLFSTIPPLSKLRVLEGTPHIMCENGTQDPQEFTEFRVFPNSDGSYSLLLNDTHGYGSPFRISSQINFNPELLMGIDSEFKTSGDLFVSDLITVDKFTFQIEKTAYNDPKIRLFKNGIALGNFDEVSCYVQD
jgi:hypothetical protein